MKFYVIASSSKGNASYLEVGNHKILIDAGISYTSIKNALAKIDVKIKEITDLFITHEHNDHIKGLIVLLKHVKPNIYMSKGTQNAIKFTEPIKPLKAFDPIKLTNLKITPLPLSHDAEEPLGFLFENQTKKIAYITDTGYILSEVKELLQNCTLYFLESNHDAYLLTNSKRPYHLIRRILNEKGHLSNHDSAYYFSQMVGQDTSHLIFAHVSQECNTSQLIRQTYKEILTAQNKQFSHIEFIEALPDQPLEVIEL